MKRILGSKKLDQKYISDLKLLEELLKSSKLTEADAIDIGRRIKHGDAKRRKAFERMEKLIKRTKPSPRGWAVKTIREDRASH